MTRRRKFEKELKKNPATVEELWIALQCMSEDWVCRKNPMVACLDYLQTAREVLKRIDSRDVIPMDEVFRKLRLEIDNG